MTGLDFFCLSAIYCKEQKKLIAKILLFTTKNFYFLLYVFELKWKNKKMHESCSQVVVINNINI